MFQLWNWFQSVDTETGPCPGWEWCDRPRLSFCPERMWAKLEGIFANLYWWMRMRIAGTMLGGSMSTLVFQSNKSNQLPGKTWRLQAKKNWATDIRHLAIRFFQGKSTGFKWHRKYSTSSGMKISHSTCQKRQGRTCEIHTFRRLLNDFGFPFRCLKRETKTTPLGKGLFWSTAPACSKQPHLPHPQLA